MCRAGESRQAFQPRYVSRLHQHQRSRAHHHTRILSSPQDSIKKRFLTPRHAPLPRNRGDIEVDSQPQRYENERPENERFLPELAARFDVEGIGWFQYGIRETLPHAGVARLGEARAECLHDPRSRWVLDTGSLPAVSQCSFLIAPGAERARPCSPHPVPWLSQDQHRAYLSGAIRRKGKLHDGGAVRPRRPFKRDQSPRWCHPARPRLRASPHSVL